MSAAQVIKTLKDIFLPLQESKEEIESNNTESSNKLSEFDEVTEQTYIQNLTENNSLVLVYIGVYIYMYEAETFV